MHASILLKNRELFRRGIGRLIMMHFFSSDPRPVVVVLVLLLAASSWADLDIHILDVGQGDCTLIVSPSGGTLLFDAGWNGKGNGVVCPYLDSLGLSALDYVACSHYHADHIGGIDEVVNHLGIDSVRIAALDRGWSYTTATYEDYAAAVAPKRQTITDGQVIDLGGGVTVTCVGVNGNGQLSPPYDDQYDENDLCVALLVEYGEFDFFVAGDLSGVNSSYYHDIETSVAADVGDVDVYRVDHHGSASNSNVNLVSTLQPEVSIISVGNNSYGHPTQTVIDRLVTYSSYIYQTEPGSGGTIPSGHGEIANGHIVIHVNTSSYTVNGDAYPLGTSGIEITTLPSIRIYPNPFAKSVSVEIDSGNTEDFELAIYSVEGRLIRLLTSSKAGPPHSFITWDGTTLDGRIVSPGAYFFRFSRGAYSKTFKVIKR